MDLLTWRRQAGWGVWSRERHVEIDLICLHEILETSRRLSGSAGSTSANNIPCVEEVLVHLPWWQISLYLFILKLVSVLIGNGTTEVLAYKHKSLHEKHWKMEEYGRWLYFYIYDRQHCNQLMHYRRWKKNISVTYCDPIIFDIVRWREVVRLNQLN